MPVRLVSWALLLPMNTLGFVLIIFGAALFAAMLAVQELGWRLGRRAAERAGEKSRTGTGVIEAAVFALLGLLLAFQFARASGRLDSRREMAVHEANAIGTAWLRLDMLPAEDRAALQELFRKYVDARLRERDAIPDLQAAEKELAAAQDLQQQIWSRAVAACQRQDQSAATMLLLPALNDMIDITTSQTVAAETHAPLPVVALLIGVALLSALLAGIATSSAGQRSLLYAVLFAAVTSATFYVILDLEFPRIGLIQIGAPDEALQDARSSMD